MRLHAETPPEVLEGDGARWPLLAYDELALKTGGGPVPGVVAAFDRRIRIAEAARAEWEAFWAPIRARGATARPSSATATITPRTCSGCGERPGAARVGMLDFQDALRAHPGWDFSLLHDGRRDVSPEREAAALARYFALRPEVDREPFLAEYATWRR